MTFVSATTENDGEIGENHHDQIAHFLDQIRREREVTDPLLVNRNVHPLQKPMQTSVSLCRTFASFNTDRGTQRLEQWRNCWCWNRGRREEMRESCGKFNRDTLEEEYKKTRKRAMVRRRTRKRRRRRPSLPRGMRCYKATPRGERRVVGRKIGWQVWN